MNDGTSRQPAGRAKPTDAAEGPRIVPAASVIICRDAAEGIEVLLVQRHAESRVLGGAWVFPGGKVDRADHEPALIERLDQPAESLRAALGDEALDASSAAAFHLAAVREAFEECGMLAAGPLDAERLVEAARLHREGTGFEALLRTLDLRPDTRAMRPWSQWVTPLQSMSIPGRRFDTRFFVLRAPDGQAARHDDFEAVATWWAPPRTALLRYWDREIQLAAPQVMTLAHLSRLPDVAAVLAEARRRPPYAVRPVVVDLDGRRAAVYPGDPLHPQPARVMPGPSRLVQGDGRMEPPGGFDAFFA